MHRLGCWLACVCLLIVAQPQALGATQLLPRTSTVTRAAPPAVLASDAALELPYFSPALFGHTYAAIASQADMPALEPLDRHFTRAIAYTEVYGEDAIVRFDFGAQDALEELSIVLRDPRDTHNTTLLAALEAALGVLHWPADRAPLPTHHWQTPTTDIRLGWGRCLWLPEYGRSLELRYRVRRNAA